MLAEGSLGKAARLDDVLVGLVLVLLDEVSWCAHTQRVQITTRPHH